MRVLVLGGTAWLGGYVTSTALAAGHDVTCLARGSSGDVSDGAVLLRADRRKSDAYDRVAEDEWDVVVDVSRQPGQVKSAVAALAPRAGFFVFVSSGNVYADHSTPGQDEDGALLPALAGDVMESMETYGEAKVACEQHVLRTFGPDRALIARVGLIGGPGDVFDRTGYWPWRFAHPAAADGAVLVPDAPELATQVIDVRDLAAWLVDAGGHNVAGVFNAAGETVLLPDHLEVARSVAGHTGSVVRADQQWLLEQGVQPWMGERSLPLWLTDPGWLGFNANDSSKARSSGLVTRPPRPDPGGHPGVGTIAGSHRSAASRAARPRRTRPAAIPGTRLRPSGTHPIAWRTACSGDLQRSHESWLRSARRRLTAFRCQHGGQP